MEITEDLNPKLKKKLKAYVYDILGCCQEVHREMGCWLNEYVYQDALEMCFEEKDIINDREWHFKSTFHGKPLHHEHQVDFLIRDHVILECKAVKELNTEYRQQLWNYMRLTKKRIGILYNFAPFKDQCEKYYYDPQSGRISLF